MTKKHGHVNKGYLGYKSYDSSALIVLAVVGNCTSNKPPKERLSDVIWSEW